MQAQHGDDLFIGGCLGQDRLPVGFAGPADHPELILVRVRRVPKVIVGVEKGAP